MENYTKKKCLELIFSTNKDSHEYGLSLDESMEFGIVDEKWKALMESSDLTMWEIISGEADIVECCDYKYEELPKYLKYCSGLDLEGNRYIK